MIAARSEQEGRNIGGAHAILLQDVRLLRDTTEDVFVSTGEQLLEVSNLLGATLAAVESLAALGREDVLDWLPNKARPQHNTFSDIGAGLHEIHGRITGLNEMIFVFEAEVCSLRRTVMTARFMMVHARMVLSSMQMQEQSLRSLIDQGARIVNEMERLLQRFEDAMRGMRSSVTQVEHMIGEVGATVNGVIPEALDVLIAQVGEFAGNARAGAGSSQDLARQVRNIRIATAQAVAGLQVGDATRQRLEHVTYVLESMTGDGGLLPQMAAALLADAAREQSSSLARLESGIAVLTAGLRDLVETHLGDFAGTIDRALDPGTLLDGAARVSRSLESVRPLQERTRKFERMLRNDLERLNALAREGEDVQLGIQQIAVNAVPICTGSGDDGTTATVAAEQMQHAAQNSGDSFVRMHETMQRIGTLGRQITAEAEKIVESSIQVPIILAMRINPLIERVAHDLSPLQIAIGGIIGRVTQLEFDLAPACAHTERLSTLVARVPECRGSGGPQAQEALAQIFARFTIEVEREIFRRFYPDEAAVFRAGQHQTEGTRVNVVGENFLF